MLDILVAPDSTDENSYLPQLESAGYRLVIREPNGHEHRYIKGPDTNVNVLAFSPGSPELPRHVVFRDWLRTHEEDRDLYGQMKRSVAAGKLDDILAYTEAKDALIDEIYARVPGTSLICLPTLTLR